MERADILLRFCKALADESRLRMVGLLAAREHSVQQLAASLMLKEPTVSHHLSILRQLDLATLRVDGNLHWYRLNEDSLRRIGRQAFSRETFSTLAGSFKETRSDRKVLANFVEGERLKEIPVSRKKRRVILEWLADCFEPRAAYTEAQVNALLKLRHHDTATLRRELVGYRMLERKRGLYRLLPKSEWRRRA